MSEPAAASPQAPRESFRDQVRSAVIWRSGTQIVGQMIAWAATFLVIRILAPTDYGLFAMAQVVLMLLNLLNGYGLASALIQKPDVGPRELRQAFGMLVLLNLVLGLLQLALAPVAAAYYRQEMVADLLRVQALLYLPTPFIAFSYALLARRMDFRRQAQVNLVSSVMGALAALGGALAGWGVWTLVFAPIVLFTTRAIGLTWAARSLMWPSFDFRGAGMMARYGGLIAAGQLFAFMQSQADVLIAGRLFEPHDIGIYTTALFLTQIFQNKFVPPLNEVAFSAYARIQHDSRTVATAFAKATRIIMIAALPFFIGLAVTAEPLVLVALGEKWRETVPIIQLIAVAMPFMTLFSLFPPVINALGRPGISVRNAALGAVLLPLAFLVGSQWGIIGLAAVWIVAYPVQLAIAAWWTLPVIGISKREFVRAIAPPVFAALAMAAAVMLADRLMPALPPLPRLAALVTVGGAVYAGWLLAFSRGAVIELISLIRRRP
jgi:O-antigen/teichoic acid export membrane protein